MEAQANPQITENLHAALQEYFVDIYGPEIVTDWVICAEVVVSSEQLGSVRGLRIGVSPDLTSWKLRGMTEVMADYLMNVTTNPY